MGLGEPRTVWNQIDGEAVGPTEDRWLHHIDPATGELSARVPASTADDVDAAVAAAERAARGWGATPVAERADLLDALADAVHAELGALAELESLDTGKPVSLARRMDIPRAVANLRFFAGAVRHDQMPFHHGGEYLHYALRRPVGVVGAITPWNLPLYLLTWKVAPALATGNAVVAKPSELTPSTASRLAELAVQVGIPRGVLNVVHGTGPSAGAPLVAHPRVGAISFTGGTATGRAVAAGAGIKKLSLELGGKNATIVFDDADLPAAIDGATRAAFTNQGEICLCGSRILVQRGIYDDFVAGLVERTRGLVVGDPASPATDLGALISQAHRDKVEGYLRLAVEEGGTVRCGGTRPPLPPPFDGGWFLEPAVVTGLPVSCRTATEEIFGPVVTVHPFDTEPDAISAANGVSYGLSASVWTRDLGRAHRVAAALETGLVWVNCWMVRDLRVPFGGVKASGVGREGGAWSLDFYTEARSICVKP